MKISPVPPRAFDRTRWWEPVRPGTRWFYGSPSARGAGSARIQLDTVDPPLQPLVQAAHTRGWNTLPSCAVHTVTPDGTLAAWGAVVTDLAAVRHEGLLLRDTETGRIVRWRDPSARAPRFDLFSARMRKTDGRGVLGVTGLTPMERRTVARAAVSLGFAPEPISGGLRLHLHLPSDEERERAWRAMLPVFRDTP